MKAVLPFAVLVSAIVAIGAAPPTADESMFREGQLRLRDLERRISADSENVPLRRDELRTLYFLSVSDGKWLPRAEEALAWLASRRWMAPDLVDAYRGAFEVVRAKHGIWPPAKLEALERARPLLDGAVERSPGQVEIRYLRLMSCYYLPFFFGRSWSVREDLAALARILPQSEDTLPAGLYARVASFVLANGEEMPPAQRLRLESTLEHSRRRLASTEGGNP
jgi:hypothetical protein